MGLALLLGIFFAIGGILFLIATVVLLYYAIKKKKTYMYILSGVSLVLGLPTLGIGIYLVFDIVRYIISQ